MGWLLLLVVVVQLHPPGGPRSTTASSSSVASSGWGDAAAWLGGCSPSTARSMLRPEDRRTVPDDAQAGSSCPRTLLRRRFMASSCGESTKKPRSPATTRRGRRQLLRPSYEASRSQYQPEEGLEERICCLGCFFIIGRFVWVHIDSE